MKQILERQQGRSNHRGNKNSRRKAGVTATGKRSFKKARMCGGCHQLKRDTVLYTQVGPAGWAMSSAIVIWDLYLCESGNLIQYSSYWSETGMGTKISYTGQASLVWKSKIWDIPDLKFMQHDTLNWKTPFLLQVAVNTQVDQKYCTRWSG